MNINHFKNSLYSLTACSFILFSNATQAMDVPEVMDLASPVLKRKNSTQKGQISLQVDVEVDLSENNDVVFNQTSPLGSVTIDLNENARLDQIKRLFKFIKQNSPSCLELNYTEKLDDEAETKMLSAFGMALYLKGSKLNSITSLALSGFYNQRFGCNYDYENDALGVISNGLSTLFPHIQELIVNDCSFFDRNDWQATGFANNLTALTSLTVYNHTSHVRDLEQYFKPSVTDLTLGNLEIERDFSVWDVPEVVRHHSVESLFQGMPYLRSVRLYNIDFTLVNESEPSPCTNVELENLLIFFSGLKHLEKLVIKGGTWVTDENRAEMTSKFQDGLKHLRKLKLEW